MLFPSFLTDSFPSSNALEAAQIENADKVFAYLRTKGYTVKRTIGSFMHSTSRLFAYVRCLDQPSQFSMMLQDTLSTRELADPTAWDPLGFTTVSNSSTSVVDSHALTLKRAGKQDTARDNDPIRSDDRKLIAYFLFRDLATYKLFCSSRKRATANSTQCSLRALNHRRLVSFHASLSFIPSEILKFARSLVATIEGFEGYGDYCWRQAGKCVNPLSPLDFFFLNDTSTSQTVNSLLVYV